MKAPSNLDSNEIFILIQSLRVPEGYESRFGFWIPFRSSDGKGGVWVWDRSKFALDNPIALYGVYLLLKKQLSN